jgi:hypothetical protein
MPDGGDVFRLKLLDPAWALPTSWPLGPQV